MSSKVLISRIVNCHQRNPQLLLFYSRNLIDVKKACKPYETRRHLSLSTQSFLREIQVRTSGNVTTIEGIVVESSKQSKVLEVEEVEKDYCPLCPNRLKADVKYTDVLILSQFLQPDGTPLPPTVTGLCRKAYHRLLRLCFQAQRAGLMPEVRLPRDPGLPVLDETTIDWTKYHVYFDE